MKTPLIAIGLTTIFLTSCVSKKKFVALQESNEQTQSQLSKVSFEKGELESKLSKITDRVAGYNQKINSLANFNKELIHENETKLDLVNGVPLSSAYREKMNNTLKNMDPSKVAEAKTLKDSMNLIVSNRLSSGLSDSEDIDVSIENTVVMITVSDKLLFNTASYRVNPKAYKLLEKLANVIKTEPSIEVMVEGHTDSRTINTPVLKDNWDLSVKRATSITRLLQKKFEVNPTQLIASGRSSYDPLVENNSNENRAKNRRTRIVILPNVDKFLSMMVSASN